MKLEPRRLGLFMLLGVLLAPLAGATCAPFLSVTADLQAEVVQGTEASFAIYLFNSGTAVQQVDVSSQCPLGAECAFPDLPTPLHVVPGQTAVVHLQVPTASLQAGNYSIPIQAFAGFSGSQCLEEKTLLLRVIAGSPTPALMPNAPVLAAIAPDEDAATRPGETLEYIIFVENPKPEKQFVNVQAGAAEGNAFAQSTRILPSDIDLAPNEKKTVKVEMTIPPGTPGGIYSVAFRVRATSARGIVYDTYLPAHVFVYSPTLFLRLPSAPSSGDCFTAFHGNETSREVQIANSGGVSGPFTAELQAGDDISPYLSLNQRTFELAQNERATLRVTLAPAESLAPKTYVYSAIVKYENHVALRFEDCAVVRAVMDATALADSEHHVLRNSLSTIPVRVTNTGSLVANYSLDYNPVPVPGINLTIEPSTFTLAPRESATANIFVRAYANAPLGRQRVGLTLRSPGGLTRELALNLIVASDNNTSPLEILNSRFTAFEGVPTQVAVGVKNNGPLVLSSVQLIAEGLPRRWVRIDSAPRSMRAGEQADYLMTISIPDGTFPATGVTPLHFSLYAASGLESVKEDAVVEVEKPVRTLDFTVQDVSETRVGGSVTEITLTLLVQNKGNLLASSIQPAIPTSGDYAVNSDRLLVLAPQQSDTLRIIISPTSESEEREVLLRLSSTEGSTAMHAVKLPEMTRTPVSDHLVFWKAIAIFLLLLAIFVLMAKE